jgi:hypothetical protein
MHRKLLIIPPAAFLLVLACDGGNGVLQDENGNNHLVFNGRDIAVNSVYCSKTTARVTVRFEQGVLYVSARDEPPGYEAVLRFTSPERSEYVNRKIGDEASHLVRTGGLNLDHDGGIHGEIQLMRSVILLNPDRLPDAVSKTMEVRAACPD